MYDYIRYSSPIGMLTVTAANDHITALVMDGQKYEGRHLKGEGREQETPVLAMARDWLDRYFDKKEPDPRELPLDPQGTDFQKKVWRELLLIPYGRTTSYGEIAKRLSSAPRAVGSAVGRNPISVIIPCHRVVGGSGSLTGYAGGIEKKTKLLMLEGAIS